MSVEMKTVYFTSDSKWFLTRAEAEKHELMAQIEQFIDDTCGWSDTPKEIIRRLMKRYEISERYNWPTLLLEAEEETK